jgi:hypothetical protein
VSGNQRRGLVLVMVCDGKTMASAAVGLAYCGGKGVLSVIGTVETKSSRHAATNAAALIAYEITHGLAAFETQGVTEMDRKGSRASRAEWEPLW